MMAVRAANTRCVFRSFPSRFTLNSFSNSLLFFPKRRRFCTSFVDSVLEELRSTFRSRSRSRSLRPSTSSRLGLVKSTEVSEQNHGKQTLRGGLLLEFKKDSERVLLAVIQKRDGKKNWMVSDQNGTTSSIKPQQITYIIPGIEDFDHNQISKFMQQVEDNLDPSLLEIAWAELLENNESVTVEKLAEMIYGRAEPLESYCAHILLSKDELYFSVLERQGYCAIYTPRSTDQVKELQKKKLAKETAERELQNFIQLLSAAKAMPLNSKPSRLTWAVDEKSRNRIEALAAYAIDKCCTLEQNKTAEKILLTMGLARSMSSALNLLIDIGYFPVHVNIELLKSGIRTEHSEEIELAAEDLLSDYNDLDEIRRKDMTHMKVYAIDVDEADELDDALSATRLQDGRIKIWIHVADAACLVQPRTILDKEAMCRATSIFLPTATYPMFPEKLAMEGMSLKQGTACNAVTVSVVLRSDGSIAEYSVENSTIKPTYMLTYESASELLHMNLEEEGELKLLSEAAALRLQWRRQQGAVDTTSLEPRIKVANPDDPEPHINLYVENQADPAMRLVSEMMILCGEVIATFGSVNKIPLPYRGQPQSNLDTSAFSHFPEGPIRSSYIVKLMRAAEYDFRKPIRHGILGVPGYVQFTSPIRRYMDLLAHYQVKAFLRGETPPFSAGQLEGIAAIFNMQFRLARKLFSSSLRYWVLEYLRRQPKGKRFRALILRFIKDRIAALMLVEVGLQASASVLVGSQVGDEIQVVIEHSHPRDDDLSLKQIAVD